MTTATKIAGTSLFSAPLGRSSQQIQLSLIPFPEPSANPADKARAFDFCKQSLESNKHKFEFNEFSAFLAHHIPGSCNAALQQVIGYGASLRSAFFDISNLHGESFLYPDGSRVDEAEFTLPAQERPAGISIFSVRVAVTPTTYAPEGVQAMDTPAMNVTFCLNLPQTTVYTANGQNMLETLGTPKQKRTSEEFTGDTVGTYDWSRIGTPEGSDTLEDYDLDVIIQLPKAKRQTLSQRSKAHKTRPVSTVLFQSPRLAGVLTSSDATVTTYTGTYDFMNDQASFNKTFPSRTFASCNDDALVAEMNQFIDLCMLEVLLQLIRIDYVGDLSPSLTSSTIGLTTALRNLKMRTPGDLTSSNPSNPDDLFRAFADIATQLNETTSSWGITLAHQFHAALPTEYREDIEANDVNRYQLPDPAMLTTKAKQLDALRKLRWVAVDARKRFIW
jgi:hypothetical protein